MHIACGEYLFHIGLVAFGRGCGNVCPAVQLHAECICNVLFCAEEACCDKYKVCGDNFLAAPYLLHLHSARSLVLNRLETDSFDRVDMTLFVLDELLYGGLINSWVVTEYRNGFFLTVIGLVHSGPFGPRVVCRTGIRELGHHFKLYNRLAAVADRCAHAVISRVAAAYYNNVLVLCADVISVGKV